jgi:hypothetical protein
LVTLSTEPVLRIAAPEPRSARRLAGHRLFLVVLVAAAIPRATAMLGYRPAFLYYGDSYAYLDAAGGPRPLWGFQPGGYSLLLWLFKPFHSLAAVTAVQHLMGLGVGVMIYHLLRRRFGLPAWGATLAALPPLFDAYLLHVEHGILSDTLFTFLVTSGVTVALWGTSTRHGAAAALLLALAALTRTVGLPLLLLLLGHLAVRRAGWRPVAAAIAAAAVPLLTYSGWYSAHYGTFRVASGEGVTLWARTMTFADCTRFTPAEPRLCPGGTRQDAASDNVWASDSPFNRMPGGFGDKNAAAREFALQAILARPLDYTAAVARDVSLAFHWNRVPHPARALTAYEFGTADGPLSPKPGAAGIVRGYDPAVHSVDTVQPYAGFLRGYQDVVRVPGPLLAAILLAGAVALRRAETMLPWAVAITLLVLPVAALDFDHRYVLPVVPVAGVAAAVAVADLARRRAGAARRAEGDIGASQGEEPSRLVTCPRLADTS